MTACISPRTPLQRWLEKPWFLTVWCVLAAFGSYACMYGFRKPFTAGGYTGTAYGPQLKALLVTAQVLGYMLSKFIGIKVIAEMPPARRAPTLLTLVGCAELALACFALTPPPFNAGWLFLNGLSLGLVYGLVLGFVEGRRMTEVFVAGLCASFILADGVSKSVGAWLLVLGVSERWMPAGAGLIFALPLVVFVWMLRQIPAPDGADVIARSARAPMSGRDRLAMLQRHGFALFAIVISFLLVTVLRSIRADFAPEIWSGLGLTGQPAVFTYSETCVAIGVLLINGSLVLVRDNRRAFFGALGLCVAGLGAGLLALAARRAGVVGPFAFMVLLGVGMYVPYVAVHTTIFERLIALTRERGNMGYLMYLADAAGYLGYASLMLGQSAFASKENFLAFFLWVTTWLLGTALFAILTACVLYARRVPGPEKAPGVPELSEPTLDVQL